MLLQHRFQRFAFTARIHVLADDQAGLVDHRGWFVGRTHEPVLAELHRGFRFSRRKLNTSRMAVTLAQSQSLVGNARGVLRPLRLSRQFFIAQTGLGCGLGGVRPITVMSNLRAKEEKWPE